MLFFLSLTSEAVEVPTPRPRRFQFPKSRMNCTVCQEVLLLANLLWVTSFWETLGGRGMAEKVWLFELDRWAWSVAVPLSSLLWQLAELAWQLRMDGLPEGLCATEPFGEEQTQVQVPFDGLGADSECSIAITKPVFPLRRSVWLEHRRRKHV